VLQLIWMCMQVKLMITCQLLLWIMWISFWISIGSHLFGSLKLNFSIWYIYFIILVIVHNFNEGWKLSLALEDDIKPILIKATYSHLKEGPSKRKMEGNKKNSLHAFFYEILRSFSFHIIHSFSYLVKVMHLLSCHQDNSLIVCHASKFVASTFVTIFLDDLNFDEHASIS